jgi:hypothetical protein
MRISGKRKKFEQIAREDEARFAHLLNPAPNVAPQETENGHSQNFTKNQVLTGGQR